jgi:hypothetical protein
MIEDEFGPPSVADDIRSQRGLPPPREFHVGPWIATIIIIALLIIFMV